MAHTVKQIRGMKGSEFLSELKTGTISFYTPQNDAVKLYHEYSSRSQDSGSVAMDTSVNEVLRYAEKTMKDIPDWAITRQSESGLPYELKQLVIGGKRVPNGNATIEMINSVFDGFNFNEDTLNHLVGTYNSVK